MHASRPVVHDMVDISIKIIKRDFNFNSNKSLVTIRGKEKLKKLLEHDSCSKTCDVVVC